MGFLIDTNILSELRKGERGNQQVRSWYAGISAADIYVSVIVMGEIRRGAELLRRRVSLGNRLLPISDDVADRWGQLGIPDPIPVADGLLAATALVHDLVLVTRNTRDVERSGARLLNPFEFQS